MGAAEFRTTAKGKTMAAAFDAAKDHAYYMHGHAGYTGTIAEKPSFVEFGVPPGIKPQEFIDAIQEFEYSNTVPASMTKFKDTIERACHIWLDKWGPAVGIKVAKNEYVFFGLASE